MPPQVIEAIEQFIMRVTSGKWKPEEMSVLPAVTDVYLRFCAQAAAESRTTQPAPSPQEREKQESLSEQHSGISPSQLITVKQVGALLGYDEGTIWEKLRKEDPQMPKPVERRKGRTRWLAQDVLSSEYYRPNSVA